MTPVSVLVIEDHEILSSSLTAAFALDGRARVVATATTIAAGIRVAATCAPRAVLCDRRLPDGDIEDHLPLVLAASPTSGVLVMTGWLTQRSSMAALDAGAHGIVSKAMPVPQIIDALLRVVDGHLVIPADLARALVDRASHDQPHRCTELTLRELDVLQALARGGSTTHAADELCISPHTVRNHLAHAMLKLGVHDRLGAVVAAVHLGLVSPPFPAVAAQPTPLKA